MTDNTQELDEILTVFANYDDSYEPGYEEGVLSRIDRVKKNILDWHNKQTEAVLDRLAEQSRLQDYSHGTTDSGRVRRMVEAIEAERNKLKESKNE